MPAASFSMLVTLSAGALYYVSRTASEAYLLSAGAVFGVCGRERSECGARPALKTGVMGNQSFTLSVNGRRVKVTVMDTSASRMEGTVTSTASDAEGTNGRCGSRTRAKSMRDNASSLSQTCRADCGLVTSDWGLGTKRLGDISVPVLHTASALSAPVGHLPLEGKADDTRIASSSGGEAAMRAMNLESRDWVYGTPPR